jgi:hypothetical protein
LVSANCSGGISIIGDVSLWSRAVFGKTNSHPRVNSTKTRFARGHAFPDHA